MDIHRRLTEFFENLWLPYQAITPQAGKIHALLQHHNESVDNDHVALRTWADSPVQISHLEQQLFDLGFFVFDEYHLTQKNVYARSYNHSETNTKIFLSELNWRALPADCQPLISAMIAQIPDSYPNGFNNGCLWRTPSYEGYCKLQQHSEYAAWLSVWGLRANHFTVFINSLKHFTHLQQLVDVLQQQGFELNNAGGIIKGEEDIGLIQASTLADYQPVLFSCGSRHEIPSCYYEFAQRFDVDGELYQGFVSTSADKIFESTHQQR